MNTYRESVAIRRPSTRSGTLLPLLVLIAGTACAADTQMAFDSASAATLSGSHAAVDELDDAAYLTYVRESVALVVEGHPGGERLLHFLDDRGVPIEYRRLRQTRLSPPGRGFWFTAMRPEPGGPLFFFMQEPWVFVVPRIAMGRTFLGIIAAHELQHAWDQEHYQEMNDLGSFSHVVMEQTAYQLAVDLADHHTGGEFNRVLADGLARRDYRRKKLVLIPKRALSFRLDALFGPPSPWEVGLRSSCYVIGLTYATCSSQLERIYATWEFLNLAGYGLSPPGIEWFTESYHRGFDIAAAAGDDVVSPLFGRVLALIEDTAGGTSWQGLVISGIGSDMNTAVRLVGCEPSVEPGETVNVGDPIGRVINTRRLMHGIEPHLHVELYRSGHRQDEKATTAFFQERWGEWQPSRHSLYTYFQSHRGLKLLMKGFACEAERDYTGAILLFEKARALLWLDIQPTAIDAFIARCQAAAGDFVSAEATQRRLIARLEQTLAYSQGEPPAPELGTIGVSLEPIILGTRLRHQRENLEAYREGRDTVWVY